MSDGAAKSPDDKAMVTASVLAVVVVAVHLAILVLSAAYLMAGVPPTQRLVVRMAADYGLSAPYLTNVVIRLPERFGYLAVAVPMFLTVDAAALILLGSRRRLRVLAVVWAVLVTLGLLAIPGLIWLAFRLPHIKLIEGLSR
jgi:hypothetical protein